MCMLFYRLIQHQGTLQLVDLYCDLKFTLRSTSISQLLEKHPEPATCTPSHSFKCHGELVLYRPNGRTAETIATLKFCMADYRKYHGLRNSTIWESGDRCNWYKFQMLWPNLRLSSVVDQVYSMVSGGRWQKRGKRRQPVGNAWPR